VRHESEVGSEQNTWKAWVTTGRDRTARIERATDTKPWAVGCRHRARTRIAEKRSYAWSWWAAKLGCTEQINMAYQRRLRHQIICLDGWETTTKTRGECWWPSARPRRYRPQLLGYKVCSHSFRRRERQGDNFTTHAYRIHRANSNCRLCTQQFAYLSIYYMSVRLAPL